MNYRRLIILSLVLSLIVTLFINSGQVKDDKEVSPALDSLLTTCFTESQLNSIQYLELIEKAKVEAYKQSNPYYLGRVFYCEGYMNRRLVPQKAIEAFKNALSFFEKADSTKYIAKSYTQLSRQYCLVAEYDISLRYGLAAIKKAKEVNDIKTLRYAYNCVGDLYYRIENFEKAIECGELSLNLSKKIGDEVLQANSRMNLAMLYNETSNDSMEYKCYRENIQLYQKLNLTENLVVTNINLGNYFFKNNLPDSAIKCYNYVKAQRSAVQREMGTIIDYNLGWRYFKQNELDTALMYVKNSLDTSLLYGYKESIMQAHALLSDIYSKMGNHKEAYNEMVAYEALKDEMKGIEAGAKLTKEELIFQYKDNPRVKRTANTYFLIVIILLGFSVSIFVFRKQIRRYHEKNREAHALKKELEEKKRHMEEVIIEKDKELMAYTLQLAQKKEASNQLVENISSMKKSANPETVQHLNSILSGLRSENQDENIWKEFELRFKQIDDEFFNKMKERFPSLSQNEKRLCALLKLKLNTKEISAITGQTPHSIYVARTRLRRKIGLVNSDKEMADFLQEL